MHLMYHIIRYSFDSSALYFCVFHLHVTSVRTWVLLYTTLQQKKLLITLEKYMLCCELIIIILVCQSNIFPIEIRKFYTNYYKQRHRISNNDLITENKIPIFIMTTTTQMDYFHRKWVIFTDIKKHQIVCKKHCTAQ